MITIRRGTTNEFVIALTDEEGNAYSISDGDTLNDFVANPREFYTVPESSVPADQIFGGGGNNHEIA